MPTTRTWEYKNISRWYRAKGLVSILMFWNLLLWRSSERDGMGEGAKERRSRLFICQLEYCSVLLGIYS